MKGWMWIVLDLIGAIGPASAPSGYVSAAILVLQQQFSIDQAGYVCQQPNQLVVPHKERPSYRAFSMLRVF